MKYRIAENFWNCSALPWKDAVGIEEIDPKLTVPAVIAWFTRGEGQRELAELVVDLLNNNASLLSQNERIKLIAAQDCAIERGRLLIEANDKLPQLAADYVPPGFDQRAANGARAGRIAMGEEG